jgi:tol-pal system protein YbgF
MKNIFANFIKFAHIFKIYRLSMIALFFIAFIFTPPPALSQSLQDIQADIKRMQNDLRDLQSFVYSGETTASGLKNINPRSNIDANQSGELARIQSQLLVVEENMRQLTGKSEEADFRIKQMAKRLDKFLADADFRLQQIERGLLRLSGGDINLAPLNNAPLNNSQADNINDNNFANSDESTLSPPQQGNGVATQNILVLPNNKRDTPAPTTIAPVNDSDAAIVSNNNTGTNNAADSENTNNQLETGDAMALYDRAFSLLKERKFADAKNMFEKFLQDFPNHKLAGNAQYWLGETYYVRKDFANAAQIFLKSYENYPNSIKRYHGLLKLALSLRNLKENETACSVLDELLNQQENGQVDARTITRAKNEQKNLNCL